MFTYKIDPIISNGVAKIGVKCVIPKVICIVSLSLTDDEVQLRINKLNNVIYFPDSTVNILSETAFSESIKYDEGTWVITKSKYSILLGILVSTRSKKDHSDNFFP